MPPSSDHCPPRTDMGTHTPTTASGRHTGGSWYAYTQSGGWAGGPPGGPPPAPSASCTTRPGATLGLATCTYGRGAVQ
eukprot:8682083-Alexandrium_andersonii.AAC.2